MLQGLQAGSSTKLSQLCLLPSTNASHSDIHLVMLLVEAQQKPPTVLMKKKPGIEESWVAV
jgi:hypothetical protein